jgi:peptidoglycan/LPS O-acetylase OafA/YrhL
MSAPASKRILQLDVLRGVAILLVIGRHLQIPRPDGVVGAFADAWYTIGWIGVDLFFVLSGFLIGGLLLSEHRKHGQIAVGRFLIRRGLKIYPAYFVFIAYLILMPTAKALMAGGSLGATLSEQWGLYWPNLLFLQNYIGPNPAGHTWSLAVEEHFYLLLPFALLVFAATRRMRALLPVCLVAVPLLLLVLRGISVWTNDAHAVRMAATHLRLDALLFGVGIRACAEYWPEMFAAIGSWRRSLVVVGVLLWLPNLLVEPGTAFIRTLGLTGTFLGAGAFLVAAFHTHAAGFRYSRWLVSPTASLVGWIGVYSYGIYLWHVTVIGILERIVGQRVLLMTGDYMQTGWLLCVALIGTGAVIAGVAASRIVEWPVLQLRDRFFPSRSGSIEVAGAHPSQAADPQATGGDRQAAPAL